VDWTIDIDSYRWFDMCRMIELTARHRQESELEMERLCTAQQQAERLLETKERAHRQQVKGLEEQVFRSYFMTGLQSVHTQYVSW